MAFLCTQTFLTGSDGQKIDGGKLLQNHVEAALKAIVGRGGASANRDVDTCAKSDDGRSPAVKPAGGLDFPGAPMRLRQERDFLRDDWKAIWKQTTIEFADEEAGASIYVPNRRVRIGPFFLDKRFDAKAMEKIVLHEFLHAAFAVEMRAAHHGLMEQVLIFNLKYKRPANPAGVD